MYDEKKIPKLPFGQGSITVFNDELLVYKKNITLSDGSKKRKTVYGKTPNECMVKMSELEMQLRTVSLTPQSKETLVDALHNWVINIKKPTLKSQSFKRLESTCRVCLGQSQIGHLRYQSITPEEIQLVLNNFAKEKKSKSYIKKAYDCLNDFYRYYSDRYKFDNPMRLVTMPLIEVSLAEDDNVIFFEEDDIEKFIKESQATWGTGTIKYQGGIMYAANIYLGLRIGELLALQWKDIDLDNKLINVWKTLIQEANPDYDPNNPSSKKVRFTIQESNKTNQRRYVPINKKAEDLILKHKATCQFIKADDYVISTRNRKTTTIKNAGDTIKRIEANAETKVQNSGTHTLRHTCASLYFRKGISVEIVAKILGHSPEVCRATYIHIINDQMQEAANLVGMLNNVIE